MLPERWFEAYDRCPKCPADAGVVCIDLRGVHLARGRRGGLPARGPHPGRRLAPGFHSVS